MNLSAVADAVFAVTGGQTEIVQRLPRNGFRVATPNAGHLTAAALLVEHSLAAVVTLNFDLAMSAALSAVGSALWQRFQAFIPTEVPFVLHLDGGRVLETIADVSGSTATLRPAGRGLHRP